MICLLNPMKKFIILFKKTQQCPLGVKIGINVLYIINHIMQKMSFTKTAARSIIVDMSKMYMKMIIRGLSNALCSILDLDELETTKTLNAVVIQAILIR
ncbi:hypothetical protein pdam_00010437 [Pocillopora damicornis]|uniref:Uncharacterized protein n=1 Tax=Pocillopora damicornis TaxID=46731 RepID=A0A3M6U9Q9_POCDA|nr:hypothetical protein pdam_00010437 [Pocillopora damicornis]